MSASGFVRSAWPGLVVAAATLGLIGFANVSFGAASSERCVAPTPLQEPQQPLTR
jgi:hypothetical protein